MSDRKTGKCPECKGETTYAEGKNPGWRHTDPRNDDKPERPAQR